MERSQIRLECLKLTYLHSEKAEEAVAKARALEEYIFEEKKEPEKAPAVLQEVEKPKPANAGTKKKGVANPSVFD